MHISGNIIDTHSGETYNLFFKRDLFSCNTDTLILSHFFSGPKKKTLSLFDYIFTKSDSLQFRAIPHLAFGFFNIPALSVPGKIPITD